MAWLVLLLAGLLEVGWAVGLKYTEGFSRLWPSVWVGISMILSVALLSVAMKTLPAGTAYAVWTGIGAAGTVILGAALLGEPLGIGRVVCLALILCGVIGLKLVS
ncbi:quaternary ammonium compound efflux SMR transporter SugE [Noviherbaspirillum aridicola]|uniref:Guanidinium exporter n=1 Tax=Noviherbaspirillum aridicola TaxID=2849687 RepID=A0ABQ4Q6B6_9BURK|nr:quaternary ammonium compound efflux SMR transporter SugE [Noviherbaspirillum aridicola]GIZ52249.1 putative multidrug resistance protein [Noviherbaspirillum aridicola]